MSYYNDQALSSPLSDYDEEPICYQAIKKAPWSDQGASDCSIAGIYKFYPIETIIEELYSEMFNLNVWGPILTTQEALKYFPSADGNIVNVSSGASTNPSPNGSLYAATKAAVDILTVAFARELGARKIRVNALAVGPTVTEGVKSMGVLGTEQEKLIVNAIPLGRLGLPADIAFVVSFLVSDAGGWITGDRIKTSGGL